MSEIEQAETVRQLRLEGLRRDYQILILRSALSESVKLQSHYAELLNMHDGGRRLRFASADEWIARLANVGDAPARSQPGVSQRASTKRQV